MSAVTIGKWARRGPVAENWGDKLNPEIIERLSQRPAVHADDVADPGGQPVYRVIGSGLVSVKANEVVWGEGFIKATESVRTPPAAIRAVRGPLSRARLLAQGIDCPAVFGDPAILYPLLYWPSVKRTHDYGVIQHFREIDVVAPVRMPPGSTVRMIDIRGGVKAVVDEILSCGAIVSSSLHGVICAHAYGIPAYWLKASDLLLGDGFKFRDYWASIGHHDVQPIIVPPDAVFAPGTAPSEPATPIDGAALLNACPFIDADRRRELQERLVLLSAEGRRGTIFHAGAARPASPARDDEAVPAPAAGKPPSRKERILAAADDFAALLAIQDEIATAPDRFAHANMRAIAMRLTALDRVRSAAVAYEWLRANMPESPAGLVGLTRIAASEEDWTKVRALLDELFTRFPEERKPALVFSLGRAEAALGDLDAADAIFAGLRADHPDQRFGYMGARRVAERRKEPARMAYWDEQLLRFDIPAPTTPGRIALAEAKALVQASQGRDAAALLAERNAARDDLRMTITEVRIRRRHLFQPEELDVLAGLGRSLQHNWPERAAAHVYASMAFLTACQLDEARKAVELGHDALMRHPRGRRMASWYEANYGTLDRARDLWAEYLADSFTLSIDMPCPQLQPLRRIPAGPGSTALVTVVRDEMLLLPRFLDHHRALGVRHFHVVDNASGDGTREFLLAQPDVDLWEATDGFHAAGGGMRWVNAILDQAVTHDWTLYLDVDEFVVLPDADRDVDTFTARLAAHGYDATASFMLDMHPMRWADLETAPPEATPLELCPNFTSDYMFFGDDICPWFEITGGIRRKRFGTSEPMRKMPFLRSAAGARYIDSHSTTPVRTFNLGCGLLHFKMLKESTLARLNLDDDRKDDRSQTSRIRHRRFADSLRRLGDVDEGGVRFEGWRSLTEHGLAHELPEIDAAVE